MTDNDELVSVSLSGGKDSTAMLLMMLERGERIDEVVTVDTGMEFPEMYEHLEKLQQFTGLKFKTLRAERSFEHFMFDHVRTKGKFKGEAGYGWPRPNARWCTSNLKTAVIKKHLTTIGNGKHVTQCIGIAADEPRRVREHRYPLVEYGVTEREALAYCKRLGFDWGGLYDTRNRVSCWCCPLQNLDSLRALRRTHPELWERLIEMDDKSFNSFRFSKTRCGEVKEISVRDLEDRFAKEDSDRYAYRKGLLYKMGKR